LNFRRLWVCFGVLLVSLSLWLLLKPMDGGMGSWLDFPDSDKVLHVVGFLGLTGWFASMLECRQWRTLALCALAYGILAELAQGAMHYGRQADAKDVIADGVGILLGLLAARLFGAALLTSIDRALQRGVA
jgi:hypothetical protein